MGDGDEEAGRGDARGEDPLFAGTIRGSQGGVVIGCDRSQSPVIIVESAFFAKRRNRFFNLRAIRLIEFVV